MEKSSDDTNRKEPYWMFQGSRLDRNPPPLPDWLSAVPDTPTPKPTTNRYLLAEINAKLYENMFEYVLVKIAEGESLAKIMKEAQRVGEGAQFMRWMMKCPQREARFDEAERIATRVMKHELRDIADGIAADGSEIPEDIQRSKLRIDTTLKVMGFDNKKRYGDTKTLEINQNISITAALAAAQSRVSDIIDITPLQLGNDDE
jgi:hypothetical protein